MQRLSTYIDRISIDRDPILHEVSAETAQNSAYQHNQRYTVFVESNGFGKLLHREWAISINLLVSRARGLTRCCHQRRGAIEFRHQTVNRIALHSAFTSACGSTLRISKIEIIGRILTNRKMAHRNMPIAPM